MIGPDRQSYPKLTPDPVAQAPLETAPKEDIALAKKDLEKFWHSRLQQKRSCRKNWLR